MRAIRSDDRGKSTSAEKIRKHETYLIRKAKRTDADKLAQKEYQATWYLLNREKVLQATSLYARAHPEMAREKTRRYHARHPEKNVEWCAARRAKILGAIINDFTAAQWREMKAAYDHRCVYCHRKMKRLTQDHIVSLKKGGNHTASNIVPACQSCNSKKQCGPLPCPVQPLMLMIAPPKKAS